MPTQQNIWEADWQPYDDDTDPFAGDWEATTPGAESPWQADWQEEVEEAPTFGGRVKESWEIGKKQVDIGQLSLKQVFGDVTPETEARIQAIEETIPKGPRPSRPLPEQAVRAAAEMAPIPLAGMEKGLRRGVALGGGFAAMAALAGQIPPLTAFPEEVVTVPGAAALGMSVGMISGSLENIGGIEAGLAYRELSRLKDPETGNKMDPTIAKAVGLGVGAINGAIELLQIKTFLRSIPGAESLVRKGIMESVKKVLKSKALKNIVFRAAKKYATGVGIETGQELLQETTNISGQYLATELNNVFKGTNIPRQTAAEITERLLETGKQSALAFSVFMAPGTAVSTTQEAIDRRTAGPGEADFLKADEKAQQLETKLREDFNTGKINSSELKEIQSQIPKKHPLYKTIDVLLKESEATTPEKDLMTGEVIALEPEDFLPAGAIPEIAPDALTPAQPQFVDWATLAQEQYPAPQEAIPGAFQPLAGIPAEESAQIFAGAGLYEDKARADQLEAARRAEAERVSRETYDRTARPGYEGLTEQVRERGEAAEIEGMEFKVPYIKGLLEQVKGAEAGRRIRVTDYDGTEKWFGVPSEFPAFMKDRYSKKEVVSAIEKGLSGYVFPESEVKQASIWEDVKSEAYEMRNRDLRLAADTYLAEPTAIEGLDDKAYKLLITELHHEGYSTREIEEIAARHRKTIEGDVITSIGNEYGFSNEEIQVILDDPLEAVSDLESAWKEATATKPVAAYLTPITEAEVYESEKERRLARAEPRRKEAPGRAVLEREARKQEIEPSRVPQEPSRDEIEQKGQLIAKLINEKLLPGHDVKYDGIWPAMAPDMADMYQFTPYAKDSPAFKATFISMELEADAVLVALNKKIKDFTERPPEKEFKEAIDLAAAEAETEPTEAQIEAGNYKKGHISLYGLDITIENPKGSIRKGVDKQGKPWETVVKHHYGYILRTEDKDGDQVDVFVGDAVTSDKVFVVNQIDPGTKSFDEHKTMMGFETVEQARVAYLANYERGWKGLGNIVSLSVDEFKAWLKEGDQTKPASKFDIKGHALPFMTEHKTKAELDKIYQAQVKQLTERAGPDKAKRAEMLAEVISAYKIELKKYPAEKAPIEKAPAPKALKEILKHPSATEAEATREKAHLKAMVIEGVKSGKYKGAVRFSTVIDLKKTVEADKLYISRYGEIHATPILGPDDDIFPAYGSYKNHAVAYIIPDKYVQTKPDAQTKEVVIDPDTPLDQVTFLIDGQDKEFNIIELISALDARPTPEQLIKQYRDEYGETEAMEFYREVKGRQPRFSWQGAVVHRSTIDPDGWRITYFDAAGFSGHSEHKTIEEAVGDAIDAGITTPKPGLLDKTAEEPAFLEGTLKVYKAQKEHAARMAAAKKLPEVEYHEPEDLAKEGYTSWDSRQGYDTDEEALQLLKSWQKKNPPVDFKLSRHADGTLSVWGKPAELHLMTKAEQLEKIGRPVREHREAIVAAHKAGKTIPTEVLDDFPEISKRLGFKKKEKAEPLVLTPEKGTPWERQAELEREGAVERPAKGKKVKAEFGKPPITGAGIAGRQAGLFGYEKGETADMFAEAEEKAKREKAEMPGPPKDLKDYLTTKELNSQYRRNYFDQAGKQIASSRETPAKMDELPLGSWRIEDFKGIYGSEIEQLRSFDPNALTPGETTEPAKLADVDRYAEWAKEGLVPPPIMVVETVDGDLRITDGHRRWQAAKQAGTNIVAWVSPITEVGKYENGQPILTGLTFELANELPIPETHLVGDMAAVEALREKGRKEAEAAAETTKDLRDMIWGTTNEIERLQTKKDKLRKQAIQLTPYSARREQLTADGKKITDRLVSLRKEVTGFKERLAKLEKKEAKLFVKTLEQVRADAKKGKKAGIDYTGQMEVAETGDIVEVTTDAGTALNEADNRLENYNKLLECIESD